MTIHEALLAVEVLYDKATTANMDHPGLISNPVAWALKCVLDEAEKQSK